MTLGERSGTDLLGYLTVLRRRKWLIAGMAVVVVASALGWSLRQTPLYEASGRILIQPDRSVLGTNAALNATSDYVATQMEVIQSQPIQALVKTRLGSAPKVSTAQLGTTAIVQISAFSTIPAQAANVANAYVDSYLTYRQRQAADAVTSTGTQIQTRIDSLQKQIDGLSNQLAALPACTVQPGAAGACSQRATVQQDRDSMLSQQVPLKQELDQLRVNSAISGTGTQVVLRASKPTKPVRPTPIRNALLGLGLGLVLGTALAFLFEYLDDSIKSKEDFEAVARGVPVLALIPSVQGWKDVEKTRLISQTEPGSPPAEAYRSLRTSISFLALDRPLRAIQVTSAGPGEGKTTTAANLAVVLSRAGERVIVVSCDLRRPRLHLFFGLSNEIGFTSVLLGDAQLSAALQPVGTNGRLWVLASGPIPPNPSELLSSTRTTEVLSGLLSSADIVIIDCPPVLPVTDAAVLSTKVDGTLLVVAAGTSTNKRVSRAVEMLRQVGAPLIGAVVNKVSEESAYSEQYHYLDVQPPSKPHTNGSPRSTTSGARNK